jgi:hypothetical protein
LVLWSLASAVFNGTLAVSASDRLSVWFRNRAHNSDRYRGDTAAQNNIEQKAAEVYSLVVTALLAMLLAASLWRALPAAGAIAAIVALYRWLEILLGLVLGLLLAKRPLSDASVFSVGLAGVNLVLIAAIATVVFLGDKHDWYKHVVPRGAVNVLYVSTTNLVVLGNNSYVPHSAIARVIVAMTAVSGVALLAVGLARAISELSRG